MVFSECQAMGDECNVDGDCCFNLNCLYVRSFSRYYDTKEKNVCWTDAMTNRIARNSEFLSSYYRKYYPQSMLTETERYQRKKLEWDNCRFHEDCGDGYCCYVHFRFRSLPKSFCRPNRGNKSEMCEPKSKYRSSSPQQLTPIKTLSNYYG
ncbi:unnamed protein product [Didymodactylos carnosus]|uniref:Uncharacterized protein n=1 Tax=Didymodactylos carnosus TaxID=1234261 RepID=A0A813PYS3_9BILA|nr:unnamed protein product [Didymodactylos carnosus]CAF3538975.1 unnamed protein product [Didymodactylos carnosus]